MLFSEMDLPGAFLIEPEPQNDERGFFARTWCRQEFEAHGLETTIAQCSVSFNTVKGTLRGIHFQVSPHDEVKIVRCTMGAVYDVIIDLRSGSPTRYQWAATELSATNRRQIYIPQGFAHGFQTLVDDTEVLYQISAFYHPESARGILWNDPALRITWPLATPILSERDRSYRPLDLREQP
ncbi:MAG TPA: dTDP-4-dehydrorhamnose 3,5-epimerase [Chloroflexota bacterium]|nr:dTDP-4-dehydrorhamnose 3,5-epimerase [Chloroflexota bacterium]